jgi:chromosome segregation ATPase
MVMTQSTTHRIEELQRQLDEIQSRFERERDQAGKAVRKAERNRDASGRAVQEADVALKNAIAKSYEMGEDPNGERGVQKARAGVDAARQAFEDSTDRLRKAEEARRSVYYEVNAATTRARNNAYVEILSDLDEVMSPVRDLIVELTSVAGVTTTGSSPDMSPVTAAFGELSRALENVRGRLRPR